MENHVSVCCLKGRILDIDPVNSTMVCVIKFHK